MRLICTKLYYYRFKYDIFSKGLHPLKYIDEFKPGDETLKQGFRLQVFCLSKYVDFCRIRSPPSFNQKKLKGDNKWTIFLKEGNIKSTPGGVLKRQIKNVLPVSTKNRIKKIIKR